MTRGLRRGEVGRQEWSDVDLDDARTLSVLEDEDAEAAAGIKGDSSRRVVMLGAENVRLLRAWRQMQRVERLAMGEGWTDSGKVFTDELGLALDLDCLTYRWKRLVRASGLPPVRLHDLRHCAATLTLGGGVEDVIV
ncbi:tyrosine-type recombinase/integrase [Nonomuraea sp. LPB2021202275-12-8]|uniref:tyrosine-type recombinase/integrase n=1 Tax=Nonomuraea sp. LPB2021202275-12-8 TaxID=3120159 RepID=UPI00300CA436